MKRVRVLIWRFLAVAVLAIGVVVLDQRAHSPAAAPGLSPQSTDSPAQGSGGFGTLK